MENLNNVPSSGTYGGAINEVNHNFSLVKGAIDGLEGRTIRSKGLFPTVAALNAAYPSPIVGDYAYVGSGLPAEIYDCVTAGTWHDTGQTGGSETINLGDYSTTTQMNAAIDSGLQGQVGYAVCSTAGATKRKDVVVSGFKLLANGGALHIKMTTANTNASATMNISPTSTVIAANTKPLFYNGEQATAENTWAANEILSIYYDGTNYQATNSQGGGGKAEKIKYDNSQSGLEATDAQGAIDELAEKTDVSVSGVSSFERGQIDDNGKDSTASASYYIRTPASSPIPIINGQTMNLTFIYKNSSGTTITPDNTRIYKYLDGVYVSRVQTTAKTAVVECDGTFNQLRIRAFRNGIGSLYSYCSVKYLVEKTLRDVAEQVDTNTADIASITANLQDVSTTVESMEGQTINKRQYTSSDLGSSYYVLDNPYQTTGSYSIYGGIKVPVKRGDHITLYTIGSSGAAKCWGLVDEYRKILSRSSGTNYLTNPAEIDVTRDCYLCANVATTKAAEKAQFKLIITSNVQTQIEGAVSDLNALIKRAPQFCNNPFPFKGETLKVLSLGNSFAEDTSAHLEGMMNAAGLDKSKFCYYFTFKSGATLQQYASNYVSGELYNCIDKNGSYTTTPRAGTYSMPNSSGSLKKIVSQDWDLILLQQASTDAYEWSSYIPYITRLVNYIKRDCPKACIGFMLTWATTYTGTTHAPSYAQRYEMNVNCAKKVLHEIGIDFIVAPGTAIQNARNTSLEDSDHLLRDNRHLNTGVGRYVAGCAFFDAVIAPFYGVSIIGNSYTTSAGTPVTDDNKLLCQQCGHAAVANMFEVTTGIDPTYTVTFKDGSTTISTTTGFTGTAVDIPANPEKEGYIFSGWSTDGTTVVTPVSTIGTSNITYLAVWQAI